MQSVNGASLTVLLQHPVVVCETVKDRKNEPTTRGRQEQTGHSIAWQLPEKLHRLNRARARGDVEERAR